MDQTAEQCVQALQALYSSPDQAMQKQADAWLCQFQQSPAAWQVCDQILSHADTPVQFRFFAAQTMRTKVQFDFYELPSDSYANLRDTLLSHVDKFRAPECQPIQTQLAMAVADLAIQLDQAWPDVVETVFQRFGQNAESWTSLLEVLRMLPEENQNHKLMTDTAKRYNTRDRFSMEAPKVFQFCLTLQCPSAGAKKKVLECFLAWIKFAPVKPEVMAQNPMLPELFEFITQGGELAETATDIIIEILRMSNRDLQQFQPVIQVIFSHLSKLFSKFEALMRQGPEHACEVDCDGLLQICRIYVETAECLVEKIMEQCTNPEVITVLQVICQCTDLPAQEISSIPLEFWHRLAFEVCRHPERDAQIDQFQSVYVQLLGVCIRRCSMAPNQDPFMADDDITAYRARLLSLVEDCLEVLTPNSGMEHVLQSLQKEHQSGVSVQEAHFYVLTVVVPRAKVQDSSVLWQLIKSLPPLISQNIEQDTSEAAMLNFAKRTAIELLGNLCNWVKTRPDFLRSALEMISVLLLSQAPPGSPPHILERTKQVQQSASMAFREICIGGRNLLQDFASNLIQLYVQTMTLPIRMHLFIVEGVSTVAVEYPLRNAQQGDRTPEIVKSNLEQLVTPLVTGLASERERPNVLSEILDRLTTIIQKIKVKDEDGSGVAIAVGGLISNTFWPGIQETLRAHPGDAKVVEKSCRLLKHSMRCVPSLFKPNVSGVASTLIMNFQQHQHSSYLYSAEILANTYAEDPEIVPVLTHLFHQLSTIGLQCLMVAKDQGQLENITELVEDFYGMFDRYLRFAPTIVLEAPTLPPVLQLWHSVIFVQQKDAIEAIISFIESVLGLIAETAKAGNNMNNRYTDARKVQYGTQLRPHVIQVMPGFTEAVFRLIAGVPTRYVQEVVPSVLKGIKDAFPMEFPGWLENAFQHLPPSVASQAERQKLGEQLVGGGEHMIYDALQDLCYRCEQVALRNRASTNSTTGQQ
jgi:transportin-3